MNLGVSNLEAACPMPRTGRCYRQVVELTGQVGDSKNGQRECGVEFGPTAARFLSRLILTLNRLSDCEIEAKSHVAVARLPHWAQDLRSDAQIRTKDLMEKTSFRSSQAYLVSIHFFMHFGHYLHYFRALPNFISFPHHFHVWLDVFPFIHQPAKSGCAHDEDERKPYHV